jgi:glycine/D-amino acid oxidase-like deaminating enzyme
MEGGSFQLEEINCTAKMEQPNINTFSPNHSVDRADKSLPPLGRHQSISIVGAGAFGGWSALYLLRSGYKVTLIDAWGPGNSRSSSGDETRVIRSSYGANELYFALNTRALQLWKQHEIDFNHKLFFNTGVLWLCYRESNPIIDDSIPYSVKYRTEYERLSIAETQTRYPEINTEDLSHTFLDPFGGYLKARESCQAVVKQFMKEGGVFVQAGAMPGKYSGRRLTSLQLSNGDRIQTDAYLFACGSWLPALFPEVLANHIHCTRQEVYYFGVPSYCAAAFDNMPVWIDLDGHDFYYGIPGNTARGFKVGVDKRGAAFDPTTGDRIPDDAVLSQARKFLHQRFPRLSHAPLIEARVCPYENSSTGNFIFDQHPGAENVFFCGGGSGHGFKHGPALGELVAKCFDGTKKVPALFAIA